jgi:phosphoenolpyruvate-protein kinase (PTS system EI component)
VGAAPGLAVGRLRRVPGTPERPPAQAGGPEAELRIARRALLRAQDELRRLVGRLRQDGRHADAEILDAEILMCADDVLLSEVRISLNRPDRRAPEALMEACERYARALVDLPDRSLAARAADVRSIGRRAARHAGAAPARTAQDLEGCVVAAGELGPGDVVELADVVAGLALADGAVLTHAVIVARSLGVPMVVGLGPGLLELEEGREVAIDGEQGGLVLSPTPEQARCARAAMAERAQRCAPGAAAPAPTTRDGHRVRLLVNAGTAREVRVGLRAGAVGIGLLRTEMAFLDAPAWPSVLEHRAALRAVLDELDPELPATIRLLDLGADKRPPFLTDARQRGIALLLCSPGALAAQLEAIIEVAAERRVRVLVPMVESPDQMEWVRGLVRRLLGRRAIGFPLALGAMIETPAAVARVEAIAGASDFLSVGTNDLTHAVLGTDRLTASTTPAHHPLVLAAVARTVAAGEAAGSTVEVCGEAASDPLALPLLIGLGADEISVGGARVRQAATWVRKLSLACVTRVAGLALRCESAEEVAALVGWEMPQLFGERSYLGDDAVDGVDRVRPLGSDP